MAAVEATFLSLVQERNDNNHHHTNNVTTTASSDGSIDNDGHDSTTDSTNASTVDPVDGLELLKNSWTTVGGAAYDFRSGKRKIHLQLGMHE